MMTSVLTHIHRQFISLGDAEHQCLNRPHNHIGFFIQQDDSKVGSGLDSFVFVNLVGVYARAYPIRCPILLFR